MNFLKLAVVSIFVFGASQALAETALTITGMDASGAETVIEKDIDDLKAMEQTSYSTINEFVEMPTSFSGPLLRDVIAPLAFSESDTLVLTAINEYKVEIPVSDAIKYDVIVALEKDGAPMSIRENGPLWVIYPMSEHPELQEAIYTSRLIWQLIGIDVK